MKSSTLKNDIQAGFSVFLLALPLCLGIAMASNFPPVAGIITAVVGGLLSTFIGSSRLTIKGPAAGLIVIVLGAVTELGHGDATLGYKRALATIAVAAVIQILFSLVKAAKIGEIMPPSVIHGMLAAIGVIIIAKQAHVMMGVQPAPGGPISLLAQIPNSLLHLNPEIFVIGLISIMVVIFWPKLPLKKIKVVPATLTVLLITIPLAMVFRFEVAHAYSFLGETFSVGPSCLISLPASFLNALTFPDFSVITSAVSIKYIIMFALVGSIESILTVIAIDGIDPEKKNSDLNKDLFATGVGNLVSALCGGLPMISEIVRSKANLDYGAKTKYANFFHGLFLLLSIGLLPMVLEKIPLAALAALLVFTGFRLASPHEFKKTYGIGVDQFALFISTLIVTLLSDLLVGVAFGLFLKVILHLCRGVKPGEFFGIKTERRQNVHADKTLTTFMIKGSLVFTNYLSLKKIIMTEVEEKRPVTLDFSHCHFIDHTILLKLHGLQEKLGQDVMKITGLENHVGITNHHLAARKLAR